MLYFVFVAVASTVKQALHDSLVQILQPKRRVDILRDVMDAQGQRRPFVITFCGVNGVGKSTNLAKVSCHKNGNDVYCLTHTTFNYLWFIDQSQAATSQGSFLCRFDFQCFA